jgi:hypothetical protein
VYLKYEFGKVYVEFKKERQMLISNIAEFQEDTLMELTTCKEMERWYDKEQQVVERLKFIEAVQKGQEKEDHEIQLVSKRSLNFLKRSTEYWAKMPRIPHKEIQEQWARCEKKWDKINKIMKDIRLPEYATPDMFIDLNEIIKLCTEQDVSWAKECAKVTDVKPGQVQHFKRHPIKSRAILQKMNFSLTKYRVHVAHIRGIYAAPMEQHRFPWANTYEELFIKWSNYEIVHPFQETTQVDC